MHLLAMVKLRPTPPVLREEIMILMSFSLLNCSICLSREMGDTFPVICIGIVSFVTRCFPNFNVRLRISSSPSRT